MNLCAERIIRPERSELFGYEEGTFTGARTRGKPGKFELAKGGTMFLLGLNILTPSY
jgi:transcriptional regulator with PAS, ATPase and Fis domain